MVIRQIKGKINKSKNEAFRGSKKNNYLVCTGTYTENALRDSQKSTVPENMPSGNFPVESRTKRRETC